MSNVPEARRMIEAVVADLERLALPVHATELREALALMTRRSPARRRAPDRSRLIEAEDAAAIRSYARAYPHVPLQDIAVMFGTNAGRVSEAMHGER